MSKYSLLALSLLGGSRSSRSVGRTLRPRGLFSPSENKKRCKKCTFCVPREARTLDPLIKSQLLYQLS